MPQKKNSRGKREDRQQQSPQNGFRSLELPAKIAFVELDVAVHDLAIREAGDDRYLSGLVLKGTGVQVRDFRKKSLLAYEQAKEIAASIATKVAALNQFERAFGKTDETAKKRADIETAKASIVTALDLGQPVPVFLELVQCHSQQFVVTIDDIIDGKRPTLMLGGVEIAYPDEIPEIFRQTGRMEYMWFSIENARHCVTVVGMSGKIGQDTISGQLDLLLKSRKSGEIFEHSVKASDGAVWLVESRKFIPTETQTLPKPASLIPAKRSHAAGGDQMAKALETAAKQADPVGGISAILARAMSKRTTAPEAKPEPAALEPETAADGDSEPEALEEVTAEPPSPAVENPAADVPPEVAIRQDLTQGDDDGDDKDFHPGFDAREEYLQAMAEANPPPKPKPDGKKDRHQSDSSATEVDDEVSQAHVVPGRREIGKRSREIARADKDKQRRAAG